MKAAVTIMVAAVFFHIASCSTGTGKASPEVEEAKFLNGYWNFQLQIDSTGLSIPVRAHIHNDQFTFFNGHERIVAESSFTPDSESIIMPVFGTYFNIHEHSNKKISGFWINPFREDYSIPFIAHYSAQTIEINPDQNDNSSIYEVTFSPETSNAYPAVGLFNTHSDSLLSGTFLTETGDYRFLQGAKAGEQFWLSTFDGAHLFYFTAHQTENKDSLRGMFYSGKHYKEPWSARINPTAKLAHPDSITQVTKDPKTWSVSVIDEQLSQRTLRSEDLLGQVTIVQILGTWCPNCMDETRFFSSLKQELNNKDLHILPVAFERGSDTTKWSAAIGKYKKSLDLDYPFFIGGAANKGKAAETFHFLSGISSFPTTLIVDKTGTIRRVHTGFYGPGTGVYFERYKEEMTLFIRSLLAEDHSGEPS
jgi:thiol-disulfide isomerase/thioredoxin